MKKILISESHIDDLNYSKWKRNNVTYRGIKDDTAENNGRVSNVLGDGLYTVPRSNISMAKQYGELHYVVNAIPKKPKIFQYLNDWEIWFQTTLLAKYSYDRREFDKATDIRTEMLKLGYDGIIIKGREMVNYTPKDIVYFKNENQLRHYYDIVIK